MGPSSRQPLGCMPALNTPSCVNQPWHAFRAVLQSFYSVQKFDFRWILVMVRVSAAGSTGDVDCLALGRADALPGSSPSCMRLTAPPCRQPDVPADGLRAGLSGQRPICGNHRVALMLWFVSTAS